MGTTRILLGLWLAAALAMPVDALALPGPELLLPMAAGALQALALLAAPLASLWRRIGRWRWAASIFIAWVVLGGPGWVLFALLLIAWRRRSRGAMLGAAIWVGVFALRPGVELPPLPSLTDALANGDALHPSPPMPASSVPALRAGAVIVHVGERGDFDNCRAPGGYLVRPADLPGIVLPEGAVILVAERRARGVDIPGAYVSESILHRGEPDRICYSPTLGGVWAMFLPRPSFRPRASSYRGASSEVGVLRALDVGGVPDGALHAREILAAPTASLPALLEGRAVFVSGSLDDLYAAAQLVRAARPDGGAEGSPRPIWLRERSPLPVAPLGPWGLALFAGGAALVAAASSAAASRWRRRRVASALASGRRPPRWLDWLVAAPLIPIAAAACARWTPIAPSLSPLLSPPTGAGAALGAVAIGGGLLLWLRLAPPAGRAWWSAAFGLGWLLAAPVVLSAEGGLAMVLGLPALWAPVAWAAARDALARRGAVALPLERARVGHEGFKAGRLGAAARRSAAVPPGVVIQVSPGGEARAARQLRSSLGPIPLLIRSTAPDEDASCGRYESLPAATPAELVEAIARVREGYGRTGAQPILAAPLIPAVRGGAGRLSSSRLEIESAPGRDAVTSGEVVAGRARIGRWSGAVSGEGDRPADLLLRRFAATAWAAAPVALATPGGRKGEVVAGHLEWLESGGQLWWVQIHPAPSDPPDAPMERWCAEALAQIGPELRSPVAPLLERIGDDALPIPAPERTLRLWAEIWRRRGALGRALRMLGIPTPILAAAPERAAARIGGGLYALLPEAGRIEAWVRLRAALPGYGPARRAASIARAAPDDSLTELAARSLALRLLQPLLAEGDPEALPDGPSAQLVAALRAGAVPAALAHRSPGDLDPASPRYGAASPAPPPPPQWLLEARALDAAGCALARDHLRDRMSWWVARERERDPSWAALTPVAALAPPGRWGLRELEALAASGGAGAWVSGAGPVEGTIALDGVPGIGRILLLDRAAPDAIRPGWGAIVARGGGSLSHAALVARRLGVPALFGIGGLPLVEGARVRLGADGAVEVRVSGEGG